MKPRPWWRLRRSGLFRWGLAAALLFACVVLLARSGRGLWASIVATYVPLLVILVGVSIWMGILRRREISEFKALGCSEHDATQRVKRNMWGWMAVMYAACAIYLIAASRIVGSLSGGRLGGVTGPMTGSGLVVMAVVAAWIAVARGKLVGVGPHCRRCGYPAASDTVHQCPECGVPLVTLNDFRDGRIERPPWIVAFAIAATLGGVALVTLGGGRLFFSIGVGVLPTSMVIGAATGPEMFEARRAWDELETRTLSPKQRRALIVAVLTRWEADGALPSILEQDMAAFIEAELSAGRMAPEQVDRLAALSVPMAAQIFAKKLLPALRSVPLSGEQQASLTDGVIELVREQPYLALRDSDAEWLFNRLAQGALSETQRRECVEIAKHALAQSGIISADRVESVILATADKDIRSEFLALLVQAAGDRPPSVLFSNQRDLFNKAILEGWLNDSQAAVVLQDDISSYSILSPDLLDSLVANERDNAIRALIAAVDEDPLAFHAADPRKWSWLLAERQAGRLNEDQAQAVDKAAIQLEPAIGESPGPVTPP